MPSEPWVTGGFGPRRNFGTSRGRARGEPQGAAHAVDPALRRKLALGRTHDQMAVSATLAPSDLASYDGRPSMPPLTSIEICAGGGGQAVGLAEAGFHHLILIENDPHACATLRTNRRYWNVLEEDL